MSNTKPFTVALCSRKNCFVSYPTSAHGINDGAVLKLTFREQCVFLSASGHHSVDSCLQLSWLFGNKLGIKNNDNVSMNEVHNVSKCKYAYVEPLSVDDWEILEMNADYIEENLLNQINVIWKGLVFPCWVQKSICIFLKISHIEPSGECVWLNNQTEVVVSPKARMKENWATRVTAKATEKVEEIVSEANSNGTMDGNAPEFGCKMWKFLRNTWMGDAAHPICNYDYLTEISSTFFQKHLRVQIVTETGATAVASPTGGALTKEQLRKQPTVIVVASKDLQLGKPSVFLAVEKVHRPGTKDEKPQQPTELNDDVTAAKQSSLIIRCLTSYDVTPGHVIVHQDLCSKLELKQGDIVRLQTVNQAPCELQSIVLVAQNTLPFGFLDEFVILAFKSWVLRNSTTAQPLLILDDVIVRFPLKQEVDVVFKVALKTKSTPEQFPFYAAVNRETCDKVAIIIDRSKAVKKPRDLIIASRKLADYADNAWKHVKTQCKSGIQHGGVVISGPRGSGKSTQSLAIQQLAEKKLKTRSVTLSCKGLRGKRVENIQKAILDAFAEARWHAPSVLVLDDLDALMSSSDDVELSGEGFANARLAQCLLDVVLSERRNQSTIAVVVTCSSRNSLHSLLTGSRGHHVTKEWMEIPALNAVNRVKVLREILSERELSASEDCLVNVAQSCDGFVLRDFVHLVDLAVQKQTLTQSATETLAETSFRAALENFSASALIGADLHPPGNTGFSGVGGLGDVIEELTETVMWPSKYPDLYAQCALRLRTGILLYGPPGCAKTLLAGALAKECGLNFLSVKGPELLSKYIGQSEQGVRDLFQRATSASPCLLFFDEFDALAPRRGHDSTGVTDRVVNQLLTQLDGVEGLKGVYVLAATSRPDLIDPALLRPGRLDKSILCPMPNHVDRLQILQVLSRDLNLAADVELDTVAKATDHFSGADLQALLYDAQLLAIHDRRETSKVGNIEQSVSVSEEECSQESYDMKVLMQQLGKEKPADIESKVQQQKPLVISAEHVRLSLNKSFPSVSEEERTKYNLIYEEFKSSKKIVDVSKMEKRVTLA